MISKKISKYIVKLIKNYPEISAGRVNYEFGHKRIVNNLNIIKKFKKKLSKNSRG
jgi:hypothetical protein